jgi:hypothetical protein
MKRPTFFISSTIHDFQDIRSALKFYLEEQGCKVLASEFNDFTKPLDRHSYDACLSSINEADYFVLLIGTRVGGWYDEGARVSITQREYREAYELQRSGKLKLLSFVRSSVWQVREDRRELENFLKELPLDVALRKTITNFPSKFASDAEFLSGFIAQVGRNRETKLAVQGGGVAPAGNWLHVFEGFKDIVDVLQGQLFLATPIEDLTLRRLLRRELRDIVAQCLVKFKAGAVYSPRTSIDRFHQECPLSLEGRQREFTTVSVKRWNLLSTLAFHLLSLQLHPVVLPQAISSSTFLEFELATDSYKETLAYEALLALQNEVRRFNRANTTDTLQVVFKYAPANYPRRSDTIDIETTELAAFLHLLDRWANVIEISRSLLQYLEGAKFEMPSLRPDSPVQGMQEQLEEERPTASEVDEYLRDGK